MEGIGADKYGEEEEVAEDEDNEVNAELNRDCDGRCTASSGDEDDDVNVDNEENAETGLDDDDTEADVENDEELKELVMEECMCRDVRELEEEEADDSLSQSADLKSSSPSGLLWPLFRSASCFRGRTRLAGLGDLALEDGATAVVPKREASLRSPREPHSDRIAFRSAPRLRDVDRGLRHDRVGNTLFCLVQIVQNLVFQI